MRSQVGIPVHGPAVPEGDIHVATFPSMEVAAIRHQGPASQYPKTYAALQAWTDEHGFEWDGPSFEVYLRRPRRAGKVTQISAKIFVPVRRRATA